MGTKLYVGNLNYNTTEESLREAFSANGREVTSVSIIMDRETGRSRGFAFVEMSTPEFAQQALQELDGQELDGRMLRINEAREREARGPGGPQDRVRSARRDRMVVELDQRKPSDGAPGGSTSGPQPPRAPSTVAEPNSAGPNEWNVCRESASFEERNRNDGLSQVQRSVSGHSCSEAEKPAAS